MKTMVISCLEPHHLKNCLDALKMWLPEEEIYVLNNGNTDSRTHKIATIAQEAHVNTIRPAYVEGQKNTKPFIQRITNDFAKRFPDEVILKVDEDNILISERDKFLFERGAFFFPVSTINNYTTRIFLKKFWPDLLEKLEECTWMWHEPDPIEFKNVLFDAIYGAHPKDLIKFTETQNTREYITSSNYEQYALMSDRGISTHAVAFHAQDHIDHYGEDSENQEMYFFRLVREGKMHYVVDHSTFCHHVNYHTVRELVQKKPELVELFHKRIFEYYAKKPSVARTASVRPKVCVAIGWYADKRGGTRGSIELAPQLFKPQYLAETLVPRIKTQLNPEAILLYISECEVPPDPIPEGVEVLHGKRHAKRDTSPGRTSPYIMGAAHDWGATMMAGAMYAYCNDLDYVFYEQDCLIHNFRAALEWARNKPIVYGYGSQASFKSGWAEPSFTFVSREFLPEMMRRLNQGLWHQWNKGLERFINPEIQFHNTFADIAEYWPFGHGMLRPINYDQEIYFAQRFSEKDFLEFLKKSPV